MWHVEIDLHRESLTFAALEDDGRVRPPERFSCADAGQVLAALQALRPFRAVIEAMATYRWLCELLAPHGNVLLEHPLRLRAMINRRTNTDRLDAQLLAQLLKLDQIPLSYIPDARLQQLGELMRYRTSLSREGAKIKTRLRHLLAVRKCVRRTSGRSAHAASTGSVARSSARSAISHETICWTASPVVRKALLIGRSKVA